MACQNNIRGVGRNRGRNFENTNAIQNGINNVSNVLGLSQMVCPNTGIEGLSSDNWCTLLSNFIGHTCTCEFDIGNELVSRTGVLSDVGTDYLVLASNHNRSSMLLCDTCSLRLVRVE